MAPPSLAKSTSRHAGPEEVNGQYSEPLSGVIISVILAMLSLVIISIFLTQRFLAVKIWSRLPFVQWLVFAIYADSFLFVFATAILQFGLGVDTSITICEAAILLCLVCYVTTKLIYLFLVEKAHIIRPTGKKPRMRSKLYLTNSFGMIGIYTGVVVLNFIYRITRVENGQCIIGMKKLAMIPLITFDLLVNIYLTILFLIPLSGLYSFKNMQQTKGSRRLRTVALRTFVGSICTLASSIVNLSVLMALEGEPGWVCLMCCNSDILFSAIVIQWVTSRDSNSTHSIDSVSISQAHSHSHAGDELGHMRSQRSHQRSSRNGERTTSKLAAELRSGRRGSLDSDCSPKALSSTEAIVDDAADISIDDIRRIRSPCSNCGPFADDRRLASPAGTSSSATHPPHPEETNSNSIMKFPRPPAPTRTASGSTTITSPPGRHIPSTSEVVVHVDYGASLSRETTGKGARLGNSVIIGASDSAGGGTEMAGDDRRGRHSPWFLAEGPEGL